MEPTTQEAAQAAPEIDLRAYWEVILKRRWTIVAFLVATVGVALIYTLRQTKIYEASASVIIDLQAPRVLGQQNVEDVVETGASYWYSKEYFLTQYKVITSRAVAERVVDRLRLREDNVFLGLDERPASDRERLRGKIDPVERMREKIRVDPVKDSRVVFIRIEDPAPQRAALYANAVADAYIQHNLQDRIQTTRSAGDWLGEQTSMLRSKLESSELSLYEFKKANDTLSTSLEDRQNIVSQRLLAFNESLNGQRTRRAELDAKVSQIRNARTSSKNGEIPDSLTAVLASPIIQQLKLRVAEANEEFGEVNERYLPEHPKHIVARKKLDAANATLRREVDKLLGAAESDLAEAKETEKNLIAMIEETKREAFEINKLEIEYKKVARDAETNRHLYDLVLKRLKETDLSSALQANNIRLLDAAQVPGLPIRPRVRLNVALALLLGLLGGVGIAFVLAQLDNSVKGQEDVEKVLGVTFLGIVPSIREENEKAWQKVPDQEGIKNRDRFIETHPRASVAECCRAIRTNLLFMTPDKPLRKLLVFSSSPQEGKTTTAVSLAITMAQGGQKTLIVDSDMRRPRLHKTFGVPSATGLSTAILDEAALEEAVKTTDVPDLFVLPCGPIPPNPTEILHSAAFVRIVEELATRFDRILFDSPPALAVADAAVLAQVMDGALLVVKGGHTQKALARRALQIVENVHCAVLGAILNDVDLTKRGYGYGYGYGYGHYYTYYGQSGD